jgi:hypothetical protein
MRAISSFTLGAALLVTGVAFAQTPATAPDSNTKNSDVSQNNAPGNNTPSKATDANGTSGASAQSVSACKKQASDKKLTGDDKTKFMNDCKMGKTTRTGN